MKNKNEKDKKDRIEGNIPPDSKIHGRVAGSENLRFEEENNKHDISAIDRQEGEMNNGTLGADLKSDKKD